MAFKGLYYLQDTLLSFKFFQLNFKTKIISKEKKKKKESTLVKWRVSKKQVFFKKYYHPRNVLCKMDNPKLLIIMYGVVVFFKKPGGLELAFL